MPKTYCIFSANYLPSIGGTEKYTQNLAQALSVMGDHIIIVTMNVFNLPQYEVLEKDIEIFRLPCNNLLKGRYPIPKRNQSYRAAIQQLEKLSIDYIVVNARFYLLSLVGMKLAVTKGITPIVIDHGSAHLTMGNRALDILVSISEHMLTCAIKRYPAHYYSVSKASVEWLRHFGIKAHGVLNNAIDAKEFRNASSGRDFRKELNLSKDVFVVVYVGRFIPEK